MFTVPRKAPPSMLAFLEPFKYDLWGMIVVGKNVQIIHFMLKENFDAPNQKTSCS